MCVGKIISIEMIADTDVCDDTFDFTGMKSLEYFDKVSRSFFPDIILILWKSGFWIRLFVKYLGLSEYFSKILIMFEEKVR